MANNMEKEKLEGLIIDYIDNKLTSSERQLVEQELVNNPEAYRLYEQLKEVIQVMDRASKLEPTQNLKTSFDEMLAVEMRSSQKGKVVSLNPWFFRAAAAIALLVIGGWIGFYISKQNQQQERLAKIEQEMKQTKLMMMSMLENDQSASQRIMGVNVAVKMDRADAEIVDALVKAMNEDPNSNVRLAALEALSEFTDNPKARKELVASLSRQTDPVVQIALIQLMVKLKEKSVMNELQRIVDDSETMKAVKDEAYNGMMKLS
jgi:hypothetical protein